MAFKNLLWWIGKKSDEKAVKSVDLGGGCNTVVKSQGTRLTVGLSDWPVYYRQRRRGWPGGIANTNYWPGEK